jgi:predicted ATP-grasp superfamily ATP-dependent carboligase
MYCFIHKADEMAEMDVRIDPLMERSFKYKRRLEELMAPHEQIL